MHTIPLFTKMRQLAGYVENGTDCSVRFYQDDATRTWHVHVGQRGYYADSLEQAVELAWQDNKPGHLAEEEPKGKTAAIVKMLEDAGQEIVTVHTNIGDQDIDLSGYPTFKE